MKKLQKAFETSVNICFVSDEKYAKPLCTSLYSLLYNRDKTRNYDILILQDDIPGEAQEQIHALGKDEPGVSIRFINMRERKKFFPETANAYYTAAINYRLYLFDEMFTNYEKMLYFDCDMIFLEDVSKLYDTHLGEKEVAAVRAEDLRVLSQTRRAIFLDGMPYNVDNYRSDGLKMQYAEDYFNSGVLLLNLQKARQHITMSQVYELLTGHKYMFSDQDVLNMLFDGKVLPLDFCWNYTTFVAGHLQSGNIHSQTLHEFVVYYQPKVDVNTNKICGAEALVRWMHEGRLIPPVQFIPQLEREGSVCRLDYYVLEETCRFIRKRLDEGKKVPCISVNFSRRHLVIPISHCKIGVACRSVKG